MTVLHGSRCGHVVGLLYRIHLFLFSEYPHPNHTLLQSSVIDNSRKPCRKRHIIPLNKEMSTTGHVTRLTLLLVIVTHRTCEPYHSK